MRGVVLLALLALTNADEGSPIPWPGGFDPICATFFCAVPVAGCAFSKGCIDQMTCASKCPTPDKDTSPGKVDYQECCLLCSYSYGYQDPGADAMMTCLNSHNCLTLPNINNPGDPFFNLCKSNDEIQPKKELSMKDLLGSDGWWAAIGFHPIYDCDWPCQYAVMTSTGDDNLWDVQMEVPLVPEVGGGYMMIHEGWPFPTQPGNQFWLNHTDLGMLHWEHWTLLDKADDGSWVSLYYCGGTGGWKYSGGILFSKERKLTSAQRATIKQSYLDTVGLDVDKDGCTFDNSACTDVGAKKATVV